MIIIPERKRGRQSPKSNQEYLEKLDAFATEILQINSTLDFKVSSRGWCYILEEHGLVKGDFDKAQRIINDCRKSGLLPVDITAKDATRATSGVEYADDSSIEDEAHARIDSVLEECYDYMPVLFWEDQEYYVEVFVEKIDLVGLFKPVCRKFHIPVTNVKGWSDIHSRVDIMKRFSMHEHEGRQCVLLYCGDHDPGGVNISKALYNNFSDLSEAADWEPYDLIIDRFGLNYDFIQENNLSWVENLETSSGKRLDSQSHPDHLKQYVQNYLAEFGARKVEANALVVRIDAGRQLMRDAIEKYIKPESVRAFDLNRNDSVNELKTRIKELMEE